MLDYGCGSGYETAIIAKTAQNVIGVDIRKEAIDHANRTYKNSNLTFHLIHSYPLSFSDNSFEFIISNQVIEHIFDVQNCLREVKKTLKKMVFC